MWSWFFIGILAILGVLTLGLLAFLAFHPKFSTPRKRRGRISGVLYVDGNPAPAGLWVGCAIACQTDQKEEPIQSIPGADLAVDLTYSCLMVLWNEYARTDEDGRFVFDRIPQGDVELGRVHEASLRHARSRLFNGSAEDNTLMDHEVLAVVKAGETVEVVLGQGGRDLSGRFTLENDPDNSDFSHVPFARLSSVAEDVQAPSDTPPEARSAWFETFNATEEGRAWREQLTRSYHVVVSKDGRFSINNVRPGIYKLEAHFNRDATEDEQRVRPLGDYKGQFLVEKGDDSPMDLGELPLVVYREKKTGDTLSPLSLYSSKRKEIDIESFRGRYLLLYINGSSGWLDSACSKAIRDLLKTKGIGENLAILAAAPFDHRYGLCYALRDAKLNIPWSYFADGDLKSITKFGLRRSAFFLVGPDGTLLACDIPPKELGACVQRCLALAAIA